MPQIDRIGRLVGPLRITCGTCGRVAVWSPRDAARQLGGECTTTDARRRLRCSVCGERRSYRINFSA